jgi:hypothetical protein
MLIVIFCFLSILLLIGYGVLKHFYLKDKFEMIIRKKIKALGFSVISIKNTEKPNFIKNDDFNEGFYSGKIIITKYKLVQLEVNGDIKNSIVALKRIGNNNISINCYLDFYGKGVYDLIE